MQTHAIQTQARSPRIASLILGALLATIAFVVPMNIFGMYHMFSVHMAQHLLLSLMAPPLILLSMTPQGLSRFLDHHHVLACCLKFLTIPLVASLLFNANIWLWHAPILMQLMMSSTLLHHITNLLYLLTGLLFWLPLFHLLSAEMHAPLSMGKKLAYLFFSDQPMMLIGAGLTFSGPLYSFTMADSSMHMMVPIEDQQLGGLLMWVGGGVFLLVIVSSILFLRWMLQQEKKQREIDQVLAGEEIPDEYTSNV